MEKARDGVCTYCGEAIAPGEKYMAVFFSKVGVIIREGCDHSPVSGANVYLGSMDCALNWFESFLQSRRAHMHPHFQ